MSGVTCNGKKKLNFIYFTTFILISLVDTGVSARGSFVWEKAGLPRENPRVQAVDRHALSHKATVNHEHRTRVAAVTTLLGHLLKRWGGVLFHCETQLTHNKHFS